MTSNPQINDTDVPEEKASCPQQTISDQSVRISYITTSLHDQPIQ